MKKSKLFKRISVIALSAVMTAGVALAAAACGGDGDGEGGGGGGSIQTNAEGYRAGTPGRGTDPNKLTVYIFCNDSDRETNSQICSAWMDKYNQKHGTHYSVDFQANLDKGKYFDAIENDWSTNSMYDIIYVAPRYVRTYAETGSVLNLADYLDKVAADPTLEGDAVKEANSRAFGNIWKNALSYYSYQKGKVSGQDAYQLGQPVHFNNEDYGFYTDAGNEKVGLYSLPKDYSSFATGYNRIFFNEEMKKAVTTTLATESRNVKGAANAGSKAESASLKRTYTNESGLLDPNDEKKSSIVQYAVTGQYYNPYTGKTMDAKEGEPAPLINVGVPTRYFPFNYFRFDNYKEALSGGDPMALMVEAFTNGEGYTVTIPGFPNDEVKIPGSVGKDANAPYDTSMGHMTYTYAEYSALIWAMTYYINTYDGQPFNGGEEDSYGGTNIGGDAQVVFGGEQYEGIAGAAGSVLYLLPWLYGNDSDLIDVTSWFCTSLMGDDSAVNANVAIENAADWRNFVGVASDKVKKMNLDGTTREVDVQYGYNSRNFIETYGAFLALASDWNANNGGDTDAGSDNNGWAYFRAGRALFYGAGSWDGATRNNSDPKVLEFGQMPGPVSESYALYSKIKGANYTMEEYSNAATAKGSGNDAVNDKKVRSAGQGRQIYSQEQIMMNQAIRQDKWAARMDSVGYAVNGQVSNYTGEHAWKKEAAVSLVMALTIERSAQVTLTVAGAQFPNFRDQMVEFVDYQKYPEGAFKDMVTPEGYADMKYYDSEGNVDDAVAAQAKKLWDGYYDIALEMEEEARKKSTQTVGEYLKGKKDALGNDIRYNKEFENTRFDQFIASSEDANVFLGNAMKVLNMVAMWRSDREINLRMQYGLNAVRDSTMYTYKDEWIGKVDARDYKGSTFAYRMQTPLAGYNGSNLDAFKSIIKTNPAGGTVTFETPLVFALRRAESAQKSLTDAIQLEQGELNKMSGKTN